MPPVFSKDIGAGLLIASAILACAVPAYADDDAKALAKKLSNPIASLISVPLQFNYDRGHGPDDGQKAYVNVLEPPKPLAIFAKLSNS